MADRMMTSSMTSRDPERSKSWPSYKLQQVATVTVAGSKKPHLCRAWFNCIRQVAPVSTPSNTWLFGTHTILSPRWRIYRFSCFIRLTTYGQTDTQTMLRQDMRSVGPHLSLTVCSAGGAAFKSQAIFNRFQLANFASLKVSHPTLPLLTFSLHRQCWIFLWDIKFWGIFWRGMVCVSVCLCMLITPMSPGKTAEPIAMLFWTA